MTENKSRLDMAQWFAEKGISVFMCEPNSKRPLDGYSWYLRQSTDADTIAGWFDQVPDANFGCHWGANYVAIDLDIKPQHNGVREFEKICAEHGVDNFLLELDTLIVQTPSGGYHLVFQAPFPCANTNSFPEGIDVRGVVGYTVGAGSEDSRGEWRIISDAEIASLPEWLTGYLEEPGRKNPNHDVPVVELDLDENVEYALGWLRDREPALQGHNGDDHTYETIQFLRDFGLSQDKIFETLNVEWNGRCDPPWGHEELLAKIKNAWAYGQNRPGVKSPTWRMQRINRAHGGWSDYIATHYPRLAVDNTAHNLALAVDANDIPENNPVPTHRRSFKPRSEAEQDAQPDPEWLIKGVLQKETLALFYGPENSFKSFLVLDMVLSAAAGIPWASFGGCEDAGGFAPRRPLITVYIAGEGSHGIEKQRRPAWRQHRGVTEPLPFYTVNEMPFFKSADEVERLISEIREAEIEPDIIVVDTAARAMLDLDENSAKDTGVFVAACDRLKREFRCAVVVVHHSGKDNAKGSRGSTNLPASFDARFMVTGDTGSLVAKIKNEKQKDGEPWSMAITFQGEQVATNLGRNSLVFKRVTPGAAKAKETDPRLDLALEIISKCKGKMPLSMNALAEEMARRYATEELTDGELERAKEGMRNYLKKAVMGELAACAHKADKARNARWVFEDRSGR